MACPEDLPELPPDYLTPDHLLEELTDADIFPLREWQPADNRSFRLEVERASDPTGW